MFKKLLLITVVGFGTCGLLAQDQAEGVRLQVKGLIAQLEPLIPKLEQAASQATQVMGQTASLMNTIFIAGDDAQLKKAIEDYNRFATEKKLQLIPVGISDRRKAMDIVHKARVPLVQRDTEGENLLKASKTRLNFLRRLTTGKAETLLHSGTQNEIGFTSQHIERVKKYIGG